VRPRRERASDVPGGSECASSLRSSPLGTCPLGAGSGGVGPAASSAATSAIAAAASSAMSCFPPPPARAAIGRRSTAAARSASPGVQRGSPAYLLYFSCVRAAV